MIFILMGIIRKEFLSPPLFIFLTIAYVVVIRYFDGQYLWSNPDVDQWIVCAKSVIDDPKSWWTDYSLFDFTRVLTILPLSLFYWFSGQLDYSVTSAFFLLFFSAILWLQVEFLRRIFSLSAVYWGVALLVVYVTLALHHDYRAYNSEVVGVFMLSMIYLLWNKEKRNHFFVGLILGLLPFCKEQFLPLALVLYGMMLFLAGKNGGKINVYKMILGGFVGGGLWMILVLIFHGINDLQWFLGVVAHYSQNGIRGNDLSAFSKLELFFQLVWLNREMILIFPLTMMGLVILIIGLFKKGNRKWSTQEGIVFIQVTSFLMLMYLIYTPHNRSIHYNILLWPSVLFFGVGLMEKILQRSCLLSTFLALVFFVPMAMEAYVGRLRPWYPSVSAVDKRHQCDNEAYVMALKKHAVEGSSLMIWGWDNRPMVLLDAKRTCGYLYPQFAFGDFLEVNQVRNYYLKTVQNRHPTFILELVGKNRWFFSNEEEYGIETAFLQMRQVIMEQYAILERGDGYKLYKRI